MAGRWVRRNSLLVSSLSGRNSDNYIPYSHRAFIGYMGNSTRGRAPRLGSYTNYHLGWMHNTVARDMTGMTEVVAGRVAHIKPVRSHAGVVSS